MIGSLVNKTEICLALEVPRCCLSNVCIQIETCYTHSGRTTGRAKRVHKQLKAISSTCSWVQNEWVWHQRSQDEVTLEEVVIFFVLATLWSW